MNVPACVARSVFRAQEAAMRRPTFSMLADLERSQWLSQDAMRDLQTTRLNHLLHTAQTHSPWHAKRLQAAGLAEAVQSSAVSLRDLSRLPTMDKRDARDSVEQMVWRDVPGGAFRYTTGGSSGEPLIFYFGRRRLIAVTMIASAACAGLLGFVGPQSYVFAVALLLAYGLLISLDSSSLTADTAGSAEPSRRGATLAVHSMLGYAGGFVGPLIVGWALDLSGGMSPTAWAFSFSLVAALTLVGLAVFWMMRPRELVGDRGKADTSTPTKEPS